MRKQYRRKRHTGSFFFGFLLVLFIGGIAANYLRPLPKATASNTTITSDVVHLNLAWPYGSPAAIGAQGYGTLATNGAKTPRPTASIAKVITALAILEKKPLKAGEQGPTITMTAEDVKRYEDYYRAGGASVKVVAGEEITEYQALQAMLLPSANNMADSMAIWAFGSMQDYHAYANTMVKRLGMTKTMVAGDASGMLPATMSTASDLVTLGEAALNNPVVAEIVAQKSAIIPVAGTIYSANSRLGFDNIIGIKTGLTDEAGGCFLFASKYNIPGSNGQSVTIIGVIMGAPTLMEALTKSEPLLKSARPYFTPAKPIKAGETFATLNTPWIENSSVPVVAKDDLNMVAWKGSPLTPRLEVDSITHALPAGAQVGKVIVSSGNKEVSTPLVLQQAISGPSIWWRLSRYQ